MEYHKIKNVYKRDLKTNKLTDEFIDKQVSGLQDVSWILKEKIDGTNIRIMWDGHTVEFGGRTDNSQLPANLVNRLKELFYEEKFEQIFGETPVVLFGEGYGGKIQKGGNYSKTEDFILFDVYIGMYLKWDDVKDIAKTLSIDVVSSFSYSLSTAVGIVKAGQIGKHIRCRCESPEGLVAVPTGDYRYRNGDRVVVKIKTKDFL